MRWSGPHISRPLLLTLLCSLALGLALRWPYLDGGFRNDDYVTLALLEHRFVIERSGFDLYWFSGRDRAENEALLAQGYLPWWSSDDFRLSFLRPLSSGLLALDSALFGLDARGFHAHSFLWWALTLVACALVLGRLVSTSVACAALVLLSIDTCHAVPIGWIANRNALVSAALGFAALWLHVRGREQPSTLCLWLSSGCIVLSLLGGEYALSTLMYLLAYELWAAPGSLRERLRSLAPCLVAACAYLIARTALGYGSDSSSLYLSPLSAPIEYASALSMRVPALLADLVLGVPAIWQHLGTPLRSDLLASGLLAPDTLAALPDWSTIHLVLGLSALLVLGTLVVALGKNADKDHKTVRYMAAAMLLALLPLGGAVASSRLLLAPALAAAVLFAIVLQRCWAGVRSAQAGVGRRLVSGGTAVLLLAIHAVSAIYLSAAHARDYRERARASRRWSLQAALPQGDLSTTDVVVLAAADTTTATYVPWIRLLAGKPLPRSYRQLSGSHYPQELFRTGERTLELQLLRADPGGAFVAAVSRAKSARYAAGQRTTLPGFRATVLEAQGGVPRRLRFDFDRSLDAPSVVFLQASPQGLHRLAMPEVGGRVQLPFPALPWPRSASTML